MSDVVDFSKAKEAREPHDKGGAICLGCKHKWNAVVPSGLLSFECPACGLLKGAWLGIHVPPSGTARLVCNCANDLFIVTPDYCMCAACGLTYDD